MTDDHHALASNGKPTTPERWRAEIIEESKTWPDPIILPGGRKMARAEMLRAALALAGVARPDGTLGPPEDE